MPISFTNTRTTMATLTAPHPYTAFHLSRLATRILHTPRPKLNLIFASDSTSSISSLRLDANSPRPDKLTTATCHRLVRTLNADNCPANTIPLALCLLLRYRMQPYDAALVVREDIYIIMAAFLLAHKLLTDYGDKDMFRFARAVDLNMHDIIDTEWEFVEALEYRTWVRDDEFEDKKKKLDELWDQVYDPDLAMGVD